MHKQNTTGAGFTIVELLIVVVVIAILAAISVVAYTNIQSRANTSAHKHNASQAERSIVMHALQTNGAEITIESGSLVGYKEGPGDVSLLRPLTGTPDITMYSVYQVASTAGGYSAFARLLPSVTGSHMFELRPGAAGSDSMSYRVSTSAQTDINHAVSGFRVPGNMVIGWLQVSNNGTVRAYGYNRSAPHQSGPLTPHAGWNFTDIALLSSTNGTGQMALVFGAAHDPATRTQVIDWLANKYGVSL